MNKRILLMLCVLCALLMPLVECTAMYADAAVKPQSVVLNKSSVVIDLAENRKASLSAEVLPANADQDVDWKSSNSSVAQISRGTITGRKVGTAVITASADDYSSVYDVCTVTVIDSDIPEYITLNLTEITLDLAGNKTGKLTAAAYPSIANQDVDWYTSSSSIAKVSSSGVVTARKVGTAVITAKSEEDSDVSAACIVHVIDSDIPEYITLNLTEITLDLAGNKTGKLAATAYPSIANQDVDWRTSSSSIAKVSSSGVVTARKVGTAIITAESEEDDDITAACMVRVIDSRIPDSIEIGAQTMSMLRYETYQLEPVVSPSTAVQKVKYKTSRSSVVSVSSSGVLTAKKAGTATITCYSAQDSKVLDTVVVTVVQQATPKSITLTPDVDVMVLGETLQLSAQPNPADACAFFTWSTSSSSRASVSSDGVVTAKRTGFVTITCRSKQSSSVKVQRQILIVPENSPHRILLEEKEIVLHPGDIYQIEPEVQPADKDNSLKYKTSSSSRVQVDANGLITARKEGSATITVTSKVNSNVTTTLKVKVVHRDPPERINISAASSVVEKGSKMQLDASVYPADSCSDMKWQSSNTSVARVDSNGVVDARKGGVAVITATCQCKSGIKASYTVTVSDPESPTAITLNAAVITMEIGETRTMKATIEPSSGVKTGLSWSTNSSSVARVSSSGVITARKAGTAIINVKSSYNTSIGSAVMVTVVSRSAPTSLKVSVPSQRIAIGETVQLAVTPVPSAASRLYKYSSSSSSIVSVSSDGVLTAKRAGTATITVSSEKSSAIKTKLTITVYDPTVPESITLDSSVLYLGLDDTITLHETVLPANASQAVKWKSSNTSVAVVDENGKVTAKSDGRAEITCTTVKSSLSASCTVHVLDTTLATLIPERTTNISGIPANLAKIEAIRKSAINQVLSLAMQGKISVTESEARQAVINRAFEMQAFPWMTKKVQEYWSKAYAYKRYMPDTVYYGLPYIQTGPSKGYVNRRYDAQKALAEKRYTTTGKGYYLLNQDKLLDGMYVGNDCSAFVSMSQFGTSHAASYLNTTSIAKSTYYRTLSDYADLRPGDLLVKSGDHTVLFLYYVDGLKTKMMIIEQGGNGSTIICSVFDKTWFTSRGYVPRRQVSFKMN